MPVLIMLWWALLIVVHLGFYIGVWTDATTVARQRGQTTFVAPFIRALAVLPGGVLTVLVYWVVHHSSLNPHKPAPQQS